MRTLKLTCNLYIFRLPGISRGKLQPNCTELPMQSFETRPEARTHLLLDIIRAQIQIMPNSIQLKVKKSTESV